MTQTGRFIHPSAIIDDGAEIGEGTSIWHFTHLMGGCKVGRSCNIGQNVFIDNNTIIGNGVKIQNNVSIYNGVELEDDVFLGPSMVFTNVLTPRSFISRRNEFQKTIVRKGASIGANATILCGIEIGKFAMIGAGAVVTKNVAPFALITGNPGRQAGWVSEAGLRLDFNAHGVAVCPHSGKMYKIENGIIDCSQ
jgi:UDP-2-acetamido-3-amino-2,3-dideoxy-glucuronate N-acetyltransferase